MGAVAYLRICKEKKHFGLTCPPIHPSAHLSNRMFVLVVNEICDPSTSHLSLIPKYYFLPGYEYRYFIASDLQVQFLPLSSYFLLTNFFKFFS